MNRKIFVDTNIILDLLLMRAPFYHSAARLFSLADRMKIIICISTHSFTTIHYILSKQMGSEKTRNILRQFKTLVTILPIDNHIIDLALASDFKDFEDAIQYYCAVSSGIPVLLTRDIKDYTKAKILVMPVESFLKIELKKYGHQI